MSGTVFLSKQTEASVYLIDEIARAMRLAANL